MSRHFASILAILACAGCASGETESSMACEDCPDLVAIPGGSFEMGETVDYGYGPMDGPRHVVAVKPFAIAAHEVTRAQYARFVEETGYSAEPACNVYSESNPEWHIDPERGWDSPGFDQSDDHPVVCITWDDAQSYIAWLNRSTGKSYRLPSEAEWEYLAAKGGLGTPDHNSANMGTDPCCGGRVEAADKWLYTAPVGSFPADSFGVYDVRGNVWEWQADCYHQDYEDAPLDGKARVENCSFPDHRVIRGGSYGDADYNYKPTFRLRGPRAEGYFTAGFRLAADAQ